MKTTRHITLQIRELMADGFLRTKGDIRKALRLPADCEITARIRDLRTPSYGEFEVFCERRGDEYYYWFSDSDIRKALSMREVAA